MSRTPWVSFDGKDCSGCKYLNERGYCEFTACIIPCSVRATIPEVKPKTNADRNGQDRPLGNLPGCRKLPEEKNGGRRSMSVLIHNIGIPKTGYVDVRLFSDGRATTQTGDRPFYREMKIEEVPEKHGRLIDADPAADVRPVVRGKWLNDFCGKGRFSKRIVQCSLCGNFLDLDGVNAGRGDANYCPNCGADMREES